MSINDPIFERHGIRLMHEFIIKNLKTDPTSKSGILRRKIREYNRRVIRWKEEKARQGKRQET